jgi:hypothetical protein
VLLPTAVFFLFIFSVCILSVDCSCQQRHAFQHGRKHDLLQTEKGQQLTCISIFTPFFVCVCCRYYYASLNRAKTNSLSQYSSNKGDEPILRAVFKRNDDNTGSVGNYMQQLRTAPASMDYWQAIRDARYWSNQTGTGDVVGFGSEFELTKDPPAFAARINDFVHFTCGDPSFGVWGVDTVTVAGVDVTVSRHGGMLGAPILLPPSPHTHTGHHHARDLTQPRLADHQAMFCTALFFDCLGGAKHRKILCVCVCVCVCV